MIKTTEKKRQIKKEKRKQTAKRKSFLGSRCWANVLALSERVALRTQTLDSLCRVPHAMHPSKLDVLIHNTLQQLKMGSPQI